MRLLWVIILLFPFIQSCQVENPVTGKVYVFTTTVDPSLSENFIQWEELAFIDEKTFILSYSENYRHRFVRGTYSFNASEINLSFEKTAYEMMYPPRPAISAVDTNEYEPILLESKCTLKEIKLELKVDQQEIKVGLGDHAQVGSLHREIDLEAFRMGLEVQQLDFLLKKD